MSQQKNKVRIGVLGYGNSGQFLSRKILFDEAIAEHFELIFVWNRTAEKLAGVDGLDSKFHRTGSLNNLLESNTKIDLFVEVCHPDIIHQHGVDLLKQANLFIASITALANQKTEIMLKKTLQQPAFENSIYLPSGAAWGIHDIQKMANLNSLNKLSVTMKFNADALKLTDPLVQKLNDYKNDAANNEELVLYKGPVRKLAKLAPNNVNTMTCLALAASDIGLDKTEGCLIAQKSTDAHIVEIEVTGKNGFKVKTIRHNPAKKGAVTGDETYNSFLASLINANGGNSGIHFC